MFFKRHLWQKLTSHNELLSNNHVSHNGRKLPVNTSMYSRAKDGNISNAYHCWSWGGNSFVHIYLLTCLDLSENYMICFHTELVSDKQGGTQTCGVNGRMCWSSCIGHTLCYKKRTHKMCNALPDFDLKIITSLWSGIKLHYSFWSLHVPWNPRTIVQVCILLAIIFIELS